MSGTTAELVARARAGDTEAFGQLVREHERQAYGYARSRLGDAHRAQDATQEAMLAAYRNLGRLQQPDRFGAWLRGIVRYQCHRQLRVRDMDLLPEAVLAALDGGPTPADAAGALEQGDRLRARVRSLPPRLRDVVHLFYGTGCTQREVAAFLGLTPTTVNNRLHQARQLLREEATMNMLNERAPEGMAERVGTILEVDGPAVTVRFDGALPEVFDVLSIPTEDGVAADRLRVTRLLPDGRVRCVATAELEGVAVGGRVLDTGRLASPGTHVVPVDAGGELTAVLDALAGPRAAPEMLATGIKPLDLFAPLVAGGRVALLGGNGVGKVVLLEELRHRLSAGQQDVFFLSPATQAGLVREMGSVEELETRDGDDAPRTHWLVCQGGSDPVFAREAEGLDTVLFCTPLLAVRGHYPALDPLVCRSVARVSERHAALADRARALLREARRLMRDPEMLELLACGGIHSAIARVKAFRETRMPELTGEERQTVERAERLDAYLTTPFDVARDFTRRDGVYVPLETLLSDVAAIVDGEADDLAVADMLYGADLAEMRGAPTG